jgi:8-oxo-dGTP pyrophosphatase MutT (NUDIX family)
MGPETSEPEAAPPESANPVPPGAGQPIRDAATVILLRRDAGAPRVLMGQRGKAAVFMPDKFVFPGGGLEPGDLALRVAGAPDAATRAGLAVGATPQVARALPLAAIRELWEETGLRLGRPDPEAALRAEGAPTAWRSFLATGVAPAVDALRLIFRAVTPPGRPRRFDARFFLAEAGALAADPMDFTMIDHELSALQWIELDAARRLPLPFITGVVLSELEGILAREAAGDPPSRAIPWFVHDDRGSHVRMI